MTNQGALTTLNLMKSRYADLDIKRIRLACDIAMDAINKQMPKHIEHLEWYPADRDCPNCCSNLASYDKSVQYCPYCGQALEW